MGRRTEALEAIRIGMEPLGAEPRAIQSLSSESKSSLVTDHDFDPELVSSAWADFQVLASRDDANLPLGKVMGLIHGELTESSFAQLVPPNAAIKDHNVSSNTRLSDRVDCKSVGDFLLAISPLFGCYSSASPPNRNLYRGHSKFSYKLRPSALRWPNNQPPDIEQQLMPEIQSIGSFFRFADASGLEIPGDGILAREMFGGGPYTDHETLRQVMDNRISWPPTELLPLFAIAQHHGINTRLLDWSRAALVAAYFAAISAAKRVHGTKPPVKSPDDNLLCVWVLHKVLVEMETRQRRFGRTRLEFVTVPTATNSNLWAQKGEFTLVQSVTMNSEAKHVNDYTSDVTLDEVAKPLPGGLSEGFQAPLTCVTLPCELAPNLLFHLAHCGVTASSVFPGFGGVAAAVREGKLYNSDVHRVGPISTNSFQHLAVRSDRRSI
ncbi:MAG: FRG domain-containing protein [Planctomycetia bacterium]|nr:FRG domain-containing protein [Planctomycetia bacterium]